MNRCRCNKKCNSYYQNDNNMQISNSFDTIFPTNFMYGQSYVPVQYMNKTYMPDVGLKMGTIFPELVSPYYPLQDMEEIKYLERTGRNVPNNMIVGPMFNNQIAIPSEGGNRNE